VTLLTGEQVTLRPGPDGKPQVDVQGRDGGPAVGYSVRNDHGRISVIPHDVASLVPGVLDPSLFDVTGLVEMGYDDAHRADLPVIVRESSGTRMMASGGFTPTRTLASIGATAGSIQKSRATAFGAALTTDRAAGPAKIWLDATVRGGSAPAAASVDGYLDQIGAPTAWRRGLDGHGVKVAIVDSGIDTGHPALAGKVTATADFTGEGPQDDVGRGTQIASLVAGNGAGADGARKGIAPGAELISGKALNAANQGTESGLIAAMEWAVGQHADLVNVGFGGRAPAQGDDLLADAVDRLTAQSGALFVVAAGDDGGFFANPFMIETPGTAASALTVGAVDGANNRAMFTSMGPTNSFRQKPEIAAPGVGIPGAKAGARDGDNLYVAGSGTSRATPLVTGSAALLLQQHPGLTWQQLKAQLSSSAVQSNSLYSGWTGSGRVDLDVATSQSLVPNVGVIDYGAIRHPDDSPQQRTLTLTNPGTEPMTVNFADQELTIMGKTAPASGVVATPATLTVPAGGSASTTVTLDPAVLSATVGTWRIPSDSIWEGAVDVVDSTGKRRLRLALNGYDEPPMYDVSVRVLDRDGKPVSGGYVNAFNATDGHFTQFVLDDQGRGTTRTTPGVYGMYSFVATAGTTTLATDMNFPVTTDTSLTLDARKAVKLNSPAVEGQPTTVTEGAVGYLRGQAKDSWNADILPVTAADLAAGRIYITPTVAPKVGFVEALTRWRLEPTKKTRRDNPDVYEVYQNANRFSVPLVKPLDREALRDMARVDTSFGAAWGGGERHVSRGAASPQSGFGWSNARTVAAPSHRVELLSSGPGIQWWQCFQTTGSGPSGLCDDPPRTYQRGEQVRSALGTALHPQVTDAEIFGGTLTVETGLADANHLGIVDTAVVGGQRVALYRNGVKVGEVPDLRGAFPVPDGSARWRVEHSWKTDVVPSSQEATTTWEFTATPPEGNENPVQLPMLRTYYDPYVALDGTAPAWRPLPFDVHLGYQDGVGVQLKSAKLWFSSDRGKHWTQAPLVRTQDGYRTIVAPWALLPGRGLSVRLAATDRSGNSVDQTVLDLVPVR